MPISRHFCLFLIASGYISMGAAQSPGAGTERYPNNIEIGAGPLHWAAAENDLDEMRRLIESGVAVDDRATGSLSTPLHFAARDGRYEAAKLLLESGADVEARNQSVPLAEILGKYEALTAVRLFFDLGGETPLHFAVRSTNYEVAELLLDSGADVDARDFGEATPLHSFTARADLNIGEAVKVAELLIRRGADINARNNYGGTPLHSAINVAGSGDDSEIIAFLIDHGADVNARDDHGDTSLHEAAREGKTATAALLIERGADVNARDGLGQTPLRIAKGRDVKKLLRAYGATR